MLFGHAFSLYFRLILVLGPFVLFAALFFSNSISADDWLRFRGPRGSGIAPDGLEVPTEFGDERNVVWKQELPGAGASAPIVVGGRVIVTCYSGYGMNRDTIGKMEDLRRHVVCFNKHDGKLLWKKTFQPHLPEDEFSGVGVPEHGYASSTPTSDGKTVFVFFGKSGVFALDLDGNEKWMTSVGTGSSDQRWGSGASPVHYDGVLIVNASDEDQAMFGLDALTGKRLWKRTGITNVWSTPLIAGEGKSAEIVFSQPGEVLGLNPWTGELNWIATNGVQDSSVSASPTLHNDVAIVMGGRSRTAVAIRTGATDGANVTETHTVWSGTGFGRIATPVVYNGNIYYFARGVAYCQNADTGRMVFKARLPKINDRDRRLSSNYASPVIADGKIYYVTKTGTCFVLAAQPEFEILATNRFADQSEFNATPAFSDGKIFIRSNKNLYCIGKTLANGHR